MRRTLLWCNSGRCRKVSYLTRACRPSPRQLNAKLDDGTRRAIPLLYHNQSSPNLRPATYDLRRETPQPHDDWVRKDTTTSGFCQLHLLPARNQSSSGRSNKKPPVAPPSPPRTRRPQHRNSASGTQDEHHAQQCGITTSICWEVVDPNFRPGYPSESLWLLRATLGDTPFLGLSLLGRATGCLQRPPASDRFDLRWHSRSFADQPLSLFK